MAGDTPMADAPMANLVESLPDGMVLPPKEVRGNIEKTADFFARRPEMKDKMLAKNANDPRFSFLQPEDSYNPYFEWRLKENAEGRGISQSAATASSKKQAEKPKGPEPPPEYDFSARMPMISALDLDTIQLTAQFVARNGPQWARQLAQMEAGNPSFDFLRTQHSLHQYYVRLVDQYTDLLRGEDAKRRIDELEANVKDKFHILERAKQRAEWSKHQEEQKQQMEEDEAKERTAYTQIDWHDYQILDTIEFTEEDTAAELDPPTYLNDLQSASLEQKANWSLAPTHMRLDEAMPGDMDGFAYPQQPQTHIPQYPPQQGYYQQPYQPAYPMPPVAPAPAMQQDYQINQQAHIQAEAAIGAAPANAPGALKPRQAMVKCPNCDQMLPADELENHIKGKLSCSLT
jgi:splicing factor 3A subunit 1